MKEEISCYRSELVRKGRRVGNTTRLCDNAIDLLFEGKVVKVIDHVKSVDINKDKTMSHYLLRMIMDRLRNEHRVDNKYIIVNSKANPNYFTIELSEIDEKGNYIVR